MVDDRRIEELKREIGEDDLRVVMGMFLTEAQRAIAGISTGLDAAAHAKATHFLRSGALNIGLISMARAADDAATVPASARAASAAALSRELERLTDLFAPVEPGQ